MVKAIFKNMAQIAAPTLMQPARLPVRVLRKDERIYK